MWVFMFLFNLFGATAKHPDVGFSGAMGNCSAPPGQGFCSLPMKTNRPQMCSFTDQFLEFLRQRSQALTAAEQIAAEEEAQFDPGWVIDGDGQPRIEGDVSVLQHQGGDRRWRFYRPDPFETGRSTFMNAQVNAEQSLEFVERRIVQHWPDLAQPNSRWRLVEVHQSVQNSIYVDEDLEVYILEVNTDVMVGNVPILRELQFWDLAGGFFYGTIEPIIQYHIMRGISQMYVDVHGHECHSKPCFASLNGDSLQAWEEYHINSGDVLVTASIDAVREVTQVIGHWAEFTGPPPLNQAFGRRVGSAMRTASTTEEKGQLNAEQLQRAMLSAYLNLYEQTNAATLRPGHILCIASAEAYNPAEPHAVRMSEMEWNTRISFSFPLLLEALIDNNLLTHSWDGRFIQLHDTVRFLTLPQSQYVLDQYVIIKSIDEQEDLHVGLVEIRLDNHPEPMLVSDYMTMIFYGPEQMTKLQMLQQVRMDQDCAEDDCLISLNNQIVSLDRVVYDFPDGSVLRILYSPRRTNSTQNESIPSTTAVEDAETSSMPAVFQEEPSSSQATTGIHYIPGNLSQSLATVCWLLRTLWSCLKVRPWNRSRRHTTRPRISKLKMSSLVIGSLLVCCSCHGLAQNCRVGEALNPGPTFWVGTVNPSGVAGKERILAELPTGVWCITETHLSGVSQKPATNRICRAGLEKQRNWHAIPGAALPLRARSTHTGTWSGVLTLSELVTRPVQGHWDHGEFELGRAQITQSFYGPFSVLGTALYGWPRSPTWPHSLRDTNRMFDNAIREIAHDCTFSRRTQVYSR